MIMKDTVKCGLGVERTSLPGGALEECQLLGNVQIQR